VAFFPETCKFNLIMRNITDKPRLENILKENWSVFPMTVKVMKNKRVKNCHRPEDTGET
jgi:thioredoxin-related protein